MDAAELKSLKVKTGTLRRLRKELGMYVDEQAKETQKVEKLRSDGADPHDIKYAVRGSGWWRVVQSAKGVVASALMLSC